MSKSRHSMLPAAAAAAAMVATLVGACPAQAATTWNGQQVTNRMDGSRLALLHDSTGDGAEGITLRSPGWTYQTATWSITQKDDGHFVLRNEAANKCLQPSSASPVKGTTVIVKPCDGTALQDWSRRAEETNHGMNTGWGAFRPRVNTTIALALRTYEGSGSWDTLYLDQDLNSADRLWHHHRPSSTW
ncbi:hypothetical protein EF912_27915 [Streptomyces sp. WAC07061]|uniref:RICIN domain-containing protein n=1 Tax=Streptomyces sp. WAC07061 TaxID=2487410 RepID=UPI000F7958A6|nr:RICIN domain-containing protein [Streptomyces sp. WAC07061]RSS46004.1 hypothetical protein EF912_27915 [Streptomyces sp. WAC07061]